MTATPAPPAVNLGAPTAMPTIPNATVKARTPPKKKRKARPHGYLTTPLSELVEASWNYKTTNAATQASLGASIKTLGQIETLLVRELESGKLEVCNGNHRLKLFQANAEVWVYNLGPVTKEEGIAQAIKLNHTRFPSNDVKLNQAVARMKATGFADLKAAMPWNTGQIEDMAQMAATKFDGYKPNEGNGQMKAKANQSENGHLEATLTGELADRWDSAKQESGITDDQELLFAALDIVTKDTE
jgi:hypothetical protein